MNCIAQDTGTNWHLINGDSAEVLKAVNTASVDLCVHSPPFASLFVYSASTRDIGNVRSDEEFFSHYRFVTDELKRVVKPGRMVCVHAMDLPLTKATNGVIGLRDFTGGLIRHYTEGGFIFHGRVTIDRNPQGVACRKKSHSLMFATLERDRSWLSPVLPDYILLFRTPGENKEPIRDDSLSREDWIEWARPIWYGIEETNTLNVKLAREDSDERHLCPMCLDTVERCIRLWSAKGETVLDPFSGLGSTGFVALQHGRRYLGVELKGSYYATSVNNLREAERLAHEPTLFDALDELEAIR